MLSYIRLKNFKSFADITLDLRGRQGVPKKMAFIYGENGSGKSNLMLSLLFLSETLKTLQNQERLKKMSDPKLTELLSEVGNSDVRNEILQQIVHSQLFTLEDLVSKYEALNSEGELEIEIGFFIGGKKGNYFLRFNHNKVVFEELRFQIKERIGVIYSLSENIVKMSPSVFIDTEYKRELEENIEKYWGKHTFMSILLNEKATKNLKYLESRLNKGILVIAEWLNRYSVLCRRGHAETAKVSVPFGFLHKLESGSVKREDNKELIVFEKVLNDFFTQLYSDIKKVYYKLRPSDDGFEYELVLKKLLNGKIIDIPFSLESAGTQKLLEIFPFIFAALSGETVFIDEIDSGIHDKLMCSIIELLEESLEESLNGQFIITTHNTLLMEQVPNKYVYILRADAEGNKDIVTLDKYDFRTQKDNNVRLKYLNGDYAGVPSIGYLDFSEMVEEVNENLHAVVDKLEERN